MPFKDPEQRRKYDRERYERLKHGEPLQGNHGNQDHTNRLLEHKEEFEEHRGFNEVFTPRPRGNNPFNPRPMVKGSSDDPLAYGEVGTYICPIHGCALGKRGCPVCNNEEC